MEKEQEIDVEALVDEIQRYLDVVEFFRREGCEPRWRDGQGARREE